MGRNDTHLREACVSGPALQKVVSLITAAERQAHKGPREALRRGPD